MSKAQQTDKTNYFLPPKEVEYLRELALKMGKIAELPVMEERKNLWRNTNDGVPGTPPPFVLESKTFDREFLPKSLLKCQTEYGRKLETYFLRHIRHYEIFNDDHLSENIGHAVAYSA